MLGSRLAACSNCWYVVGLGMGVWICTVLLLLSTATACTVQLSVGWIDCMQQGLLLLR